jgi:L-aminopeptidase/D-esterase-like protein
MIVPGPTNGLLDVVGLSVGQTTLSGEGWLSGVTVILSDDGAMTAGVDVRGGGPGTRETDLLDPTAMVQQVNAIVLSGGSAYGLAAADGVADELGARGIGFSVGPTPNEVVPIVPAAVVFDLGRGGHFGLRPGHEAGASAARAALTQRQPLVQGCVGAGTGAVAGGFKGGIGTASSTLPGGAVVAAFVVLNAMGSVIDERTGELLAARYLLDTEPQLTRPESAELQAFLISRESLELPSTATQNTTLAVVATDLVLTKVQCRRLAGAGHDGLARAVNPVHTLFDGDTIFGLSTGRRPAPDHAAQYVLMSAAGDCVTRAVAHALLSATSITTPGGSWRSYADAFPSAV